MLTYKTYNELTIYPLERGSNKNRLVSRVDANHPDAITHYRSEIHEDHDKIVNLFTPSEQPDERSAGNDHPAAAEEVETTALYGGVLFWHFGHFLAESLHRLWCLDEIKHQGPIFFHAPTKDGKRFSIELPAYAEEALNLLGIASDRVRMITSPLRFRSIHVPEQGRILGGVGNNEYAECIRHINLSATSRCGTLYISRSQHLHSGGFLGELCLERILEKKGVDTIRPETIGLGEFARKVNNYDTLVFSEGSAIHVLELIKHLPVRVIILCRREPWRTERFFGALIKQIGSKGVYIPYSQAMRPIEWNKQKGKPSSQRTPVYFNAQHLFTELGNALELEFSPDDIQQFNQSVPLDILRFLSHEQSIRPNTTSDENYGRLVKRFIKNTQKILSDLQSQPSDAWGQGSNA